MENDVAIKILIMRAHYCTWDDVGERFNQSYSSSVAVRDALKLWGRTHDINISWAFPQVAHKNPEVWSIEPPKDWLKPLKERFSF